MDWPLSADSFWGKLERTLDGEIKRWHPLADHCLDVAAVFGVLVALPRFRDALKSTIGHDLDAVQCERLAVIAFLHDLGKCNAGFQQRRSVHAANVGHVKELGGLFAMPDLPRPLLEFLDELAGWFSDGQESRDSLLLASFSHHGRPVSYSTFQAIAGDPCRWWRRADGLDPLRGVDALFQTARNLFPTAWDTAPPIHCPPAFQHRFAGLVMLADWIGSDTTYFPYSASDSDDRLGFSRTSAAAAVSAIGFDSVRWQCEIATHPLSFDAIFGFAPSPLQRAFTSDLALDEGSRLIVAESDTGSGKTEAALAWFLRLLGSGNVEGLYFALPTRVAARELYARVLRTVATAFPDASLRPSPVLLAVPGYAKVNGEAVILTDPVGNLWSDDRVDAAREVAWAAEHPKRFLAAPIAVGTIDQALLSALQVKHAHLRSVCLDRHLLVVDEVHASDPYMRAILGHLIARHIARGGWCLLLSATLGESARAQLLNQPLIPYRQARTRPYPLVTTQNCEIEVGQFRRRDRSVQIELAQNLDRPDALVKDVATAVHAGARVLVVMNTVARANQMLRAVEATGVVDPNAIFSVAKTPCPHHGRFARVDREVLDAAVSARMGQGAPDAPCLIVGTQTLEQSLDIDADWLVTDICPMDVLLQRLGRLHRHARARRPRDFETPRAVVLVPEDRNFARFVRPTGEARAQAGIGTVYADLRVLQRTVDVLSACRTLELPAQNRELVEDSTHPAVLASLDDPIWRQHRQHLEGVVLAELLQAEVGRLEEVPFGQCQYRADDERVMTRLGASDRKVSMPEPVRSPFGQWIRDLLIPAHLAPASLTLQATDVVCEPGGFVFSLSEKRYRYTRFGLESM